MPVRILDWSLFGSSGIDLTSGTSVDVDGVDVTFDFATTDPGAAARNIEFPQFVDSGEPFDPTEGLKILGSSGDSGAAASSVTTLTFASGDALFGDAVTDVSFRINDLDLGQGGVDYTDIVTLRAFDAAGNPVPVTLTPGADIDVAGNTATGDDANPTFTPPTEPGTSLLVEVAGPITRLEIEYANDGADQHTIFLTDVEFSTTPAVAGPLVAEPDTIDTDEDTADSVLATANDSTTGTGPLSITGVDTTGLLGTVTIGADGQTLTYDPDGQFESLGAGDTATETFGYTVTDASGNSATSTVLVTINGVNDAPDAVDDSSTGIGPRTVDVLANDTDPETDTLSVISTTSGTNGTTTINADGTVTYTPEAGFTGTDTFTYDITDGNGGTDTATVTVDVLPCFTPGTMIATPKGERRVEDLQIGDRVITRDNGIQEIRWLGKRTLSGTEVLRAPHLNPVLIRKGALGHGLPERDMMVSPNHRVLVTNDKTSLYFEESEVLVAAKHLTGLEGVERVELSSVTYIHFMFDRHEVVLSDGAWTESFQPGDQTLAGIGNAQRQEIFEIFPQLKTPQGVDAYQSARRSLKKHEAFLVLN